MLILSPLFINAVTATPPLLPVAQLIAFPVQFCLCYEVNFISSSFPSTLKHLSLFLYLMPAFNIPLFDVPLYPQDYICFEYMTEFTTFTLQNHFFTPLNVVSAPSLETAFLQVTNDFTVKLVLFFSYSVTCLEHFTLLPTCHS